MKNFEVFWFEGLTAVLVVLRDPGMVPLLFFDCSLVLLPPHFT